MNTYCNTLKLLDNNRVLSAHDDFFLRIFNIHTGQFVSLSLCAECVSLSLCAEFIIFFVMHSLFVFFVSPPTPRFGKEIIHMPKAMYSEFIFPRRKARLCCFEKLLQISAEKTAYRGMNQPSILAAGGLRQMCCEDSAIINSWALCTSRNVQTELGLRPCYCVCTRPSWDRCKLYSGLLWGIG